MDRERLEHLKKRYGFDDWPAADEGGGLALPSSPAGLLPDLRLHRSEPLREDGEAPPGLRILWAAEGEGAEGTILSTEVWRCASAPAARDFLLELLDQFESPLLARLEGGQAPGDVAFGHGEHSIVFARRNLVVRIRNAGRTVTPVAAAARTIDRGLAEAGTY